MLRNWGTGRRLAAFALFALLAVTVAVPATATSMARPVYDLTLGGAENHGLSIAFAVNATGRTVGGSAPDPSRTSTDSQHAFLTLGNHPRDLGAMGGTFGEARGVNREGAVVGWSFGGASSEPRAVLVGKAGTIYLGTLGGLSSIATSINDGGRVVGASTLSGSLNGGAPPHAFSWANGTMTDLGTLGGSMSWAQDVNNAGTIVGFSSVKGDASTLAFVDQGGVMTSLGTLGGPSSAAHAINESRQVAGSAELPDGTTHAALFEGGTVRDLGTLGGSFSEARGINDAGEIVGSSFLADGATRHAFLYSNGKMVDLNTLLPAGSQWELQDAFGINRQGMVVGEGIHNGDLHAYLLSLR
jgi:probable HAF family extracellular repeat protein